MSKTRVRVVADKLSYNASSEQRSRALEKLIHEWRNAASEYGIPHSIKNHVFYQKPSEKRRLAKRQRKLLLRQETQENSEKRRK